MSRIPIVGLIAAGLLASAGSIAAERQAYKYVDEKGNVVYSQTPPTQGKDIKKMDISPANSGRGDPVLRGYTGTYPYQQPYSNREEYLRMQQEQEKRRQEAQQKRQAELKAECYRNRGTDCENPDTLRNMEAQRIPGGGYYRR